MRRDLGVRELTEVRECDDLSLRGGQVRQQISKVPRVVVGHRVGLDVVPRSEPFSATSIGAPSVVASVTPQGVDGPVAHDPEHPCVDLTAIGLVGRTVAPSREEGFLNGVAGPVGPGTQHADGDAERPRGEPVVQLAEPRRRRP